ncbi:MAG: phosphoribosylglycinamide formyltransferase [Myxococcales bacterium]|nr:phosphoribosylglycinamide formyltransferase [Polyangiaceae bacterium]MDW8251886.1 phosphoribosylglycinamide formyltransferase [Myxococcales bacterium]
MLSLGVLCSGSGTNLQAILDACASGELDARVKLVLCNKPAVMALERAKRAGVPSRVLSHRDAPSREEYDAVLVTALREAGVELVVLAGFLRLVTPVLLEAFPDRVINIHPALLPSFPGLDGQQQALAYGVTITGCTVHLVDAGMDTGPILAQAAVPVLDGDDRDTLARRVLRQEHRLLVEVIRWFVEGRVWVERAEGQRPRVWVDGRRRAFWSDEP